jgi:uncharacterized protein
MRDVVHVDERKWPDTLHWQFDARRLGEDEHGAWLHVPPSTVARRGAEPARRLEHGFVMCVPPEAWWVIEFYWDHPIHEVYVNIGTPPRRTGGRVRQVDLDLDVVRHLDGSVELLDEDEFLAHRAQLGYPADLVAGARAAADHAVDLLRRGAEPFGGVACDWILAAGHGCDRHSG